MTPKEFNYIKDSFSQIIDDIAGNPDWYEAAKAVASDLVTLERELKKKVLSLPSNLNEATEELYPDFSDSIASKAAIDSMREAFKAGAEWMAGQGVISEGKVFTSAFTSYVKTPGIEKLLKDAFQEDTEVIVQIRKKQ